MKAYYLITIGFVSEKYLGEFLFHLVLCGILIIDVYNCDSFLGPFGFLQMEWLGNMNLPVRTSVLKQFQQCRLIHFFMSQFHVEIPQYPIS